jgi:hypothetical protein
MEVTYKRLTSMDKSEVLRLIQSRIEADSKICLTNNRVNDEWVKNIMQHNETYDITHRIFGAYIDGALNTIFVLRLKDTYYIVSMMMSTKEQDRPMAKIVKGYNEISSRLLDYSLQQMEAEGFTTFYSIIPDHPKWKRAEKNPSKSKLRYKIEEVLKVPANTMPCQDDTLGFLVLDVISRPFNIDMVVRRMTRL